MSPLPLSQRPLDILFLVYFITHIPITLCIDLQGLSPTIIDLKQYIPHALVEAKNQHAALFGDDLLAHPPLWFATAILLEIVLQIPYFLFAAHAFYHGKQWIRIPTVIYASHVSTTVAMILPELYARCTSPHYNMKLLLVGLYSIYLIIPLLLLWRVCRVEHIFEDNSVVKQTTGNGVTKKVQ